MVRSNRSSSRKRLFIQQRDWVGKLKCLELNMIQMMRIGYLSRSRQVTREKPEKHRTWTKHTTKENTFRRHDVRYRSTSIGLFQHIDQTSIVDDRFDLIDQDRHNEYTKQSRFDRDDDRMNTKHKEFNREWSNIRFSYIIASDLPEKTINDQMTNAKTYRLVNPSQSEDSSDDGFKSRFSYQCRTEREGNIFDWIPPHNYWSLRESLQSLMLEIERDRSHMDNDGPI